MSETPPINPFKKTKAAASRASALAIIAIVLTIIAAVAAALAWKQSSAISKIINNYSTHIQQQADKATEDLRNTTKNLESSVQTLQKHLADVQDQLNQLSYSNAHARSQRQLGDAAYLIHMANLQIVINRNVDGALKLLKASQIQLESITDNNLISLKKAVANTIAELETTPDVDVARLLAQIEQLKVSIQKLPALPTQKAVTATTPKDQPVNSHSPWYKKLAKSLSSLKDLVIIRHEKNPIKPMLQPQQLLFLKENIQLKLSEAEWAVLHQDTTVYQQSLDAAKAMLLEHYTNQEAMTEPLKNIDELKKADIDPKMPDLSDILKVLSTTTIQSPKADEKKP
ncbi:MAG: uroporphyrinogen-III C-methyltransferase [Coxiellaceae bacterium]|nr:uroporphyrinogen-III C-methyltransferase [Coxiellaceae bacterium]